MKQAREKLCRHDKKVLLAKKVNRIPWSKCLCLFYVIQIGASNNVIKLLQEQQ